MLVLDFPRVVEETDWFSNEWTVFKDGLVLKEIVEKLTLKEVENMEMRPRTRAHCLNNIKRVSQFLQKQKNDINLRVLHKEDEIQSGSSVDVALLLLELRRVYKNRLVIIEREK